MSVRSDFATQAMSVGDGGLHLFQCVLGGLGVIAFGENSAGSADLDEVGPILDVLANFVLNLGDACGSPVADLVILKGQKVVITMAAGEADCRTTNEHVRPGHLAGV